jgi:putative transposase
MNERRAKIHIVHDLAKTRRCALLRVARSSAYYERESVSAQDLELMGLIDKATCNIRSTTAGACAMN